MKRFLKDVLNFALCFILFSIVLSFTIYRFTYPADYFKLPMEKEYVILGDSHTEFGLNVADVKFVNLSQSGEIYLFSYHKLKKIFEKNNHVKFVFVDFCNSQVDINQDSFLWSSDSYLTSRYSIYSPLFDFDDYKSIWSNNPKGLINAHLKSTYKGIYRVVINDNIFGDNFIGGHQELSSILNDSLSINNKHISKEFHLSKSNLNNLDKIIQLCKVNNAKVYFIRTPLHPKWEYLQNEKIFEYVRNKRFSQIDLLDFRNFPLKKNQFADFEHLNKKGSDRFSSFFYMLINQDLLSKSDKQGFIDRKIDEINKK